MRWWDPHKIARTGPVVPFYFQMTWVTENLHRHTRMMSRRRGGGTLSNFSHGFSATATHTNTQKAGLTHTSCVPGDSHPAVGRWWPISLGMPAHLRDQRVERSARRPLRAAVTLPPLPTRRLAELLCVRNVSPRLLAKQSATIASKVCQKAR